MRSIRSNMAIGLAAISLVTPALAQDAAAHGSSNWMINTDPGGEIGFLWVGS